MYDSARTSYHIVYKWRGVETTEKHAASPGDPWDVKQHYYLSPMDHTTVEKKFQVPITGMKSFMSRPSYSLTPDLPACNLRK